MYGCIVSLPSTASLHCSRTAVKHTWYVCLHCFLTEYSKLTLLKDSSETYQVCMVALSPYRVQQVYTAQGRQWNIPGMYGCIVSLPSTASLHCSRTAVKHTRYVCLHSFFLLLLLFCLQVLVTASTNHVHMFLVVSDNCTTFVENWVESLRILKS